MPPLKYQNKIRDCDLPNFFERERLVYRWTFEEVSDLRNFLPRALLHPDGNHDECTGWALSFFVTQEQAKKRLVHICEHTPKLYKRLGTHIGEGKLEHPDGISDNENGIGHFNHFEYQDINLASKFKVIEKVCNDRN